MEKLNKLREREAEVFEKCSRKIKEMEASNHSHR